MDHQPAGEFITEAFAPEDGIHRSKVHPIVQQQPGGRDAEGKAKGEGEQGDLGIVVEQEARKRTQLTVSGRRRVVINCGAQIIHRCVGIAPFPETVAMEGPEPVHVLHAQEEGQRAAPEQEQSCQKRRPDGCGNTGRPVPAQKVHDPLADGGAGAIHIEIGSCAQAFEIRDDVLVQRNGPGHRKR